MPKTFDERLANLSVKLGELSDKAAAASEDAKLYRQLRKEAIEEKISTAKGNVAAMQENARIAEEEQKGKIRSAMLKARMTAKAKHEDRKDARDKRRLENFIDEEIDYILDCYDAASFLIADAQLSILEVIEALQEYEERFGGEAEHFTELVHVVFLWFCGVALFGRIALPGTRRVGQMGLARLRVLRWSGFGGVGLAVEEARDGEVRAVRERDGREFRRVPLLVDVPRGREIAVARGAQCLRALVGHAEGGVQSVLVAREVRRPCRRLRRAAHFGGVVEVDEDFGFPVGFPLLDERVERLPRANLFPVGMGERADGRDEDFDLLPGLDGLRHDGILERGAGGLHFAASFSVSFVSLRPSR